MSNHTTLQGVAQIVASEFNDVRVSLGQVKQTANDAFPASQIANYATKVSLGQYSKTTDIANLYHNKTEATGLFTTQVSLGTELVKHYTKIESDDLFATKVSLGDYSKTSDIANTYATQNQVTNLNNTFVSVSSSIFTVNKLVGDSLDLSGDISIGGTLTAEVDVVAKQNFSALGELSALRANIGTDATQASNEQVQEVKGSALIHGKLVVSELDVKGTTNIINTTSVQVSDDFIELNNAEDGSVTASTAGIKINRGEVGGVVLDDATLAFNNLVGEWSVTGDGIALAPFKAEKIYFKNSFADFASLPLASDWPGLYATTADENKPWFSTGSIWVEIAQASLYTKTEDLGTLAQFQLAFYGAMDTDGDGISDANEDTDGDGVLDGVDPDPNDPNVPNPVDTDGDGVPDDDDDTDNEANVQLSNSSITFAFAENNSGDILISSDLASNVLNPAYLATTDPFVVDDTVNLEIREESGQFNLYFIQVADYETQSIYTADITVTSQNSSAPAPTISISIDIQNDDTEDSDLDGVPESLDSDDNDPLVSGQDTDNDGIDDAIDDTPTSAGIQLDSGFTLSVSIDENTGANQNFWRIEDFVLNPDFIKAPIASVGLTVHVANAGAVDSDFNIHRPDSNNTYVRYTPDPDFETDAGHDTWLKITDQNDVETWVNLPWAINDLSEAPVDTDGDGIPDNLDSEPTNPLVSGVDADSDGIDDAVDANPSIPNIIFNDSTPPTATLVENSGANQMVFDAVARVANPGGLNYPGGLMPHPSGSLSDGYDTNGVLVTDDTNFSVSADGKVSLVPNPDYEVATTHSTQVRYYTYMGLSNWLTLTVTITDVLEDTDGDGIMDDVDPHPTNPDFDGDGILDGSDSDPNNPLVSGVDADNDGVDDAIDSDPTTANLEFVSGFENSSWSSPITLYIPTQYYGVSGTATSNGNSSAHRQDDYHDLLRVETTHNSTQFTPAMRKSDGQLNPGADVINIVDAFFQNRDHFSLGIEMENLIDFPGYSSVSDPASDLKVSAMGSFGPEPYILRFKDTASNNANYMGDAVMTGINQNPWNIFGVGNNGSAVGLPSYYKAGFYAGFKVRPTISSGVYGAWKSVYMKAIFYTPQ